MSIKFFEDIKETDDVGGKGASLSKMYKNKFNIPNGYVVMTDCFNEFLIENNIKEEIKEIIDECDISNEENIEKNSKKIIQIISKSNISNKIKKEIIENYEKLDCRYVAVRSSATSEDGKSQAWAGQLESFLNVDKTNIIECVKSCWSSVFSPRAIFYRIKNKDVSDLKVAVVVQKMVQSDVSGVAFSINPTNNNMNELVIEAVLGLGEAIVSGSVTPDTYVIDKGCNKLKNKKINTQKMKLIKVNKGNRWVDIENGNLQKIDDKKILELSSTILNIEKFYGFPVDVEWGIEGEEIFILQCRPITTVTNNKLIEKIKKSGDWRFYVSRKFNWFVENTEIYASLKEYQNKILGFDMATQNYLCLNGDEYSLSTDFDVLCNKLDKHFEKDNDFFDKFAKIEFNIVEEVKEYLTYLKSKNLKVLNYIELSKEFEKFNNLYIKSFIPGMTRPEDYLIYALEKELVDSKFNKEEIELIFSKISTCPNYYPLSYSEEPLDLLKIALAVKDGADKEKLINEHIAKYAWIKGPVEFEDTAFTNEDYMARLDNLIDTNIEEKIENIIKVRKNNDIEYEAISKQYKFTNKANKLIEAIRNFIFLRTYTTEYSDHLFYTGRHTIFKEIADRTNIEAQDLIMLGDKEILNILNNKGKMSDEIKDVLEDRKKGFAMIWLNGNVKTVFGDESLELQNEIAKGYKTLDDKENISDKKAISGSVANRGKVKGIARVLNTYRDIYKVQKGDIIVATMTTPDYVSAMEKAAGFITDEGGITCHAAILSREFNVPCIVGTVNGTKEIKDGKMIELDAYNGKVYILD